MHRLRTTYGKQWLVALMLASLLPMLFATVGMASQRGASYAGWLRAQLQVPADAAVEQAFAAATQSRVRTLDDFLKVFVEAYEAQEGEQSTSHLFAALDLSDEALIVYLQGQFSRLVGDAVMPRMMMVATSAIASHTSSRPDHAEAVSTHLDVRRTYARIAAGCATAQAFVFPLRILSAAQPLGP